MASNANHHDLVQMALCCPRRSLTSWCQTDKIPPASIVKPKGSNQAENVQIPLSPKGSNLSLEDEILALRTRNQILTDTLQSIKERAEQEEKKHYDLVWFARYRRKSMALHGV